MDIDPEFVTRMRQRFVDFLDSDFGAGEYAARIAAMMERKQTRLLVNINDLRDQDPELAAAVLDRPAEHMMPFAEALREVVARVDPTYAKETASNAVLQVGLEGSFGRHHVTPRGLTARLLTKLVMVEGIVTKVSLVRPKMMKSVHFCPATSQFLHRAYRDATDTGQPTSSIYPTKDNDGNPLETEYGLSVYKDHQTIGLQEMPERAPAGQLPRSVDIILDHDLVDKVKPGDRVQIVGAFRALAGQGKGGTNGLFKTVIIANNVRSLGKAIQAPTFTDADVENIKDIARRDDVYELMSQSLAPSIYGHAFIKKALLLLLLGGVEHTLETGTHLRGDINILMVGDPSTAKSQLLRFVLSIAPLAISTTGRGSSGVGLTAAVTTDRETGERRLEAGAMVLADRGIVCIDEFDKMSDEDRVAIHEVMEQQTVTIAKAGIHASLNARCSVVAAANPIYGQYNRRKKPMENIGLPDSLLSRFDLLFIVLDTIQADLDREIAAHVLRSHRFRPAGKEDLSLGGSNVYDVVEEMDDDDDVEGDTDVYERYNALLHKGRGAGDILSIPFITKYIHYAKKMKKPKLSKKVENYISSAYAELRQREEQKTLPVTPRTLETMIRLSSAHAKLRLSKTVTINDAKVALALMKFALYHDGTEKGNQKGGRARRRGDNVSSSDSDSDGDAGPAPAVAADISSSASAGEDASPRRTGGRTRKAVAKRSPAKARRGRKGKAAVAPTSDDEASGDDEASAAAAAAAATAVPEVVVSDEARAAFRAVVNTAVPLDGSIAVEELEVALIEAELDYSPEAVEVLLREMDSENKIMFSDGTIFRI